MSSLKLGSGLCFDRPRRLSSLAGGGGDFIRAALFDNDRIERVTQPELLRRGIPNPNNNQRNKNYGKELKSVKNVKNGAYP